MNLFDWLFRKNRSAPAKPHRPKILSEFGPDSPQLVVQADGGKGVMIMDRDNYDYLYGDLPNIAPAQHDLDSLFVGITRVRAIAGGIFRGKPLGNETILDVADATTLDELFRTLKIDEDPSTFCHCACLGGHTLEFLVGTRVVATIGLQHGHSIRWTQWKHDARLKDGDRLTRWLIDNGIDKDFLDVQFHNGYGAAGLKSLGFRRKKQGQVQKRRLRRLCPKTIGCDSRTTEPVRISSPDTSVRCFTLRTVCVPLLLGVDVNQPSRDVVLSVSCTRDFGWQYLTALVNVDRVFKRLAIFLGLEVGFRFDDSL